MLVVNLKLSFLCSKLSDACVRIAGFPPTISSRGDEKKKNVVELDVDGNLRDFLGYSLGALFDTYVLLQRAKLDACG